ncbi:hypothetical protein [Methyloceanibacter sp.]|uniref:hypothetical protein n=1 Tax=Methyloceanibacter sp. TaxID=1965321 RepID=UPI002D02427F|nr:hypothetical protein [Methyloceanibacter sp.]HML93013.1 hypothetical protein [Methyloceanibacter sp.]
MAKHASLIKLVLLTFSALSAPLAAGVAHEAHQMSCNETAMRAMKADIQSMPEGEAKAQAMEEMDMAEDRLGVKDMESCEAHMDNAMKAIEE